LKNLVLDSNNIDVDISGIGSARRLELLDISATSTGSVAGIGAAVQLRELHIKQIGLSGTFPDEIFQLTALELLDFDFNSFSGPLSHAVGQLSNLKQLTGEKNELSGVLPDELRLLTSLAELRLGKNSFEGSVPASALDEMTSLSYIDLSRQIEHGGQGLSGGLPTLADLHSLTQVRLKDNNFSGMIPFNFLQNVNRDEFQYADLSSNALTGTVPASLAEIGDILLQNNMISDLPKVFCDASRGSAFAQYGCDAFLCKPGTYNRHGRQESNETKCEVCPEAKYFGSISCGESPASPPTVAPPSVNEREVLIKLFQVCGGNFWDETDNWLDENQSICTWRGVKCPDGSQQETVEKLELGGNNLKGTPPTDLFALPNLRSLSLYSNPLADFDFTGIEYANKLTELLLDATGINSINGIERAPSLELLNLRFNNIQGTFPTQIAGMTTLQALTLAYNDLTGKLPTDLEEMTNLKSLLLSHNRLSGNLNMVNFPRSIRRLDLSHNQITGSIPVSFLTLVPFNAELEVDISSNQITGSIPTDLTRFFHLNIYLKDNLISEISKQLCAMSDWNDGDVGKFGCNGLLCPAGDFAPNGRHSSSGDCEKCAAGRALHMGASTCDGSGAYTSRSGVTVLTAVASLFYCLWI
jgi:Leucine-rich repeat (LRR) protein